MSKNFHSFVAATPHLSSPTSAYEKAYASCRAAIKAIIDLTAESPAQAAEFTEAAVHGIYGAGAALGLNLTVINLTLEVE